jgi:hypothetical protein
VFLVGSPLLVVQGLFESSQARKFVVGEFEFDLHLEGLPEEAVDLWVGGGAGVGSEHVLLGTHGLLLQSVLLLQEGGNLLPEALQFCLILVDFFLEFVELRQQLVVFAFVLALLALLEAHPLHFCLSFLPLLHVLVRFLGDPAIFSLKPVDLVL